MEATDHITKMLEVNFGFTAHNPPSRFELTDVGANCFVLSKFNSLI